MVKFQARIEVEDNAYRTLAAKGKVTIDQFERLSQGVTCTQHPFHQVKVLVSFWEDRELEIEVVNSCCKKFTDLFSKKINEVIA